MSDELSIHDNFVYGYSVDCEGRRLILHTAFRGQTPEEFTDIVFSEVVAHHFEHVLPGNILFDLEQTDVEEVVKRHEGLLRDSWRYGWPPVVYGGDLAELVRGLRARSIRAYVIGSSHGLSGWVFAGSCQRVARREQARVG